MKGSDDLLPVATSKYGIYIGRMNVLGENASGVQIHLGSRGK